MTDGQFGAIDIRLTAVELGQEALRSDVAHLRIDVDGLRADVNQLRSDVDGLRVEVSGLREEVHGIRTDLTDMRRHMGVLHEELIDRLKVLAFDPAPIRRELEAGDRAVRTELLERIEPLEAGLRRKRRR